MHYISTCIIGVGVTCVLLWVLRPLASHIGLVDRPGKHKLHKENVALVGGIAMFIALTISALALEIPLPEFGGFFAAAAFLVLVGLIDDLLELPSGIRFAAQIAAALIMTLGAGVVVEDLGAITGNGPVTLGGWAIPFTVFATVGVINALNMSDGIDGLAGGFSFIAFMLLGYVAMASGRVSDASMLVLLTCIVGAFLLFNIRSPWRRRALVFMGDAGSTFLGFALAWFAISLSQGENRAMAPITALWILALPLMDTVSILLRRVLSGRSPFSGDRDHLHHFLLMAGCSVNITNVILLSSTMIFGILALYALYRGIDEHLLFYCFLGVAILHLWSTTRVQGIQYRTRSNKHLLSNASLHSGRHGARSQD